VDITPEMIELARGGCLTGIPEGDLHAASGLVASVYATATRPR
jgi:hypothetical protein